MTEVQALWGLRPNILLILSDDHGYGDLSFRGTDPEVRTPNLDRLRRSGMLLENGYVSAPICSPTRAGLIVGSHPQRWGGRWFGDISFPEAPYRTIPQVLGEAGYRSGYFGKVHYGPDQPGSAACPDHHGFDTSYYGLAAQAMGRLHYMTHTKNARAIHGDKVDVHGMFPMIADGEEVDCHRHLTTEFTERALAFMEAARAEETPYFCMVAYNAVHNFTWQLPEEELRRRGLPVFPDFDPADGPYAEWYDGVITPNLPNGRAYYLAQLELMDREIGRLLDRVASDGAEDTLVIYLTDNGGSPCNYGDNTPLRGSKYTLYEGGVRVPFICAWPGVIAADSSSANLASSLDLATTFAYLAGLGDEVLYQSDGVNLVPTWLGQPGGHEMLFFDTGGQWAVRTPDWKLLHTADDDGSFRKGILQVEHTDIGVGTRLVPIGISVDESDAANEADRHPELVASLTEAFRSWAAGLSGDA